MKRKTIAILFVCMALAAGGCGDQKEKAWTGTEAETVSSGAEESTSGASVDITYDVNDYVKLGEYMNLDVALYEEDYQVTESDVNNYADQMIAYTKPYQADESKTVIKAGDVVDVDYVGKKDGVAFDGGSAQNQIIDVSQNINVSSQSGYIEGFTDGLIGAKVGDTVDCKVTFPEDYQAQDLKGQEVTFTFTVNSIGKAITREDIDDAYVLENFQAENVEAFYDNMREFLEEQAESSKRSEIRSAILEKLMENCTISSFPEGLVEARLEEYVDDFTEYYCPEGTDLADFLQANYGMTEEQFRSENQTYLENSLAQELILEAIVEKEGIELDQEGFDSYISNLLANRGYTSKEELYSGLGSSQEAGEKYFQKVYLDNKACDMLADNANVTYVKAESGAESAESTEIQEEQ